MSFPYLLNPTHITCSVKFLLCSYSVPAQFSKMGYISGAEKELVGTGREYAWSGYLGGIE